MSDDVLVIGGGVIGLSIADALAREGLRVRVLETDRIASGASGAAAGMLAPISEVLTHAGGDPSHPVVRLGSESLSRFPSLCDRLREETGIDPEFEASGLWRPIADEIGQRAARAAIERIGDVANAVEWVPRDELGEAVPGLSPAVSGAFYSPFECHLRPPLLVRALATAALRRGAAVEEGVAVQRIDVRAGRIVGVETSAGRRSADRVVVATGAWTTSLLTPIVGSGVAPSIEPVRGQIVALEAPLPPVRGIVYADDVYCVPKRDGSWIVGATEEHVGFDRRVTADGVATLLARSRALFPALEAATFSRAWAGLRPVESNGRPRVGAVPGVEGLFVAAGHGRNGVLLAPLSAERLRDVMLGKRALSADVFRDGDLR